MKIAVNVENEEILGASLRLAARAEVTSADVE
jgi:hypothetical protein